MYANFCNSTTLFSLNTHAELVINYIEDHLSDELSLEEISEYAGVSDYHFRKIFFIFQGWR